MKDYNLLSEMKYSEIKQKIISDGVFMTRKIHPVGCGLFVTECFDLFIGSKDCNCKNYRVVYDCGKGRGKTTCKALKEIIDKEFDFSEHTHIDKLFISHFDNDHINGIPYLIEKGFIDSNTEVYLPLLSKEEVNILEVLFDSIFDYVVDGLSGAKAKINTVNPIVVENHSNGFNLGRENIDKIIFESISIVFDIHQWHYIPYYIQKDDILSEFKKYMLDNGFFESELSDKYHLLNNRKVDLKRLYHQFRRGRSYTHGPTLINMNAMGLMSIYEKDGVESKIKTTPYAYSSVGNEYDVNQSSCLYTSDLGLSSPEIMKVLEFIVEEYANKSIGLIQIPHHGSVSCYNADIYNKIQFNASFVNGDILSKNPAIYSNVINDAWIKQKPLYLADNTAGIEQKILIGKSKVKC